jgi:hypothetical protein
MQNNNYMECITGNMVLPNMIAKVTGVTFFNSIYIMEEITFVHMFHIIIMVKYTLLLKKYKQKV